MKRLSGCALPCLFALGSLIHTLAASANDGGINFGGSPTLLAHHPSVRMENEVIHLDIYAKTMRVSCNFTFVNHGKTCRVRMGFPDQEANRTGTLVAVPASRMATRDPGAIDWTQVPQTRIYYSGIGKPTVKGQTLTFMRMSWRPASNDDLMLYFRDWPSR